MDTYGHRLMHMHVCRLGRINIILDKMKEQL